MKTFATKTILLCMALAFAGASYADKPKDRHKPGRHSAAAVSHSGYFTDDRVRLIRDYYSHDKARGCPPGLAKKGNGCRPPGQTKKWRRGEVLPENVFYYDIPVSLAHELGRIPEGHKIVRVGTDLLLITIGTRMVIDAIDDLDDVF